MNHLDVILPIILLGISFLLKLVVDRNIDVPSAINAICELPVDILFLALSFSIAFTITASTNNPEGLLYCFVGLAISILVVLIWRRTVHYFIIKSKIWFVLLFINLIIAGVSLKAATDLIMEKQNPVESTAIPTTQSEVDSTKTNTTNGL